MLAPTAMATPDDKKLLGLPSDLLFKLCLYYSYGPDKDREVAALSNKKHQQGVSPKQIKDAYHHMHNIEHESYKRARDLNRKNPEQCGYLQQRLKLMFKMQLTLHLQ